MNLRSRLSENWFFIAPLLVAGLLLLVVQATQSNESVFLWINRNSELFGDTFWASLTILGDGLIACLLVSPFIRRKPQVVWATILSLIFILIWVQGFKYFLAMPRPLGVLPETAFHIVGGHYKAKAFPSGHAATAFMLAGVFNFYFRLNHLRVLLLAIASLIAVSRIAVGIHWTNDVLAGIAGGAISAWLGVTLTHRWQLGFNQNAQKFVGLLLICAAVFAFFGNYTEYTQALWLQKTIALTCFLIIGYALFLMFKTGGAVQITSLPVSRVRPERFHRKVSPNRHSLRANQR
ncbi:MAG: phosphatase PAP2 family protein [Pyrinomonadaceae bacterium]|nr:phosphatase PAP2 family protein [Pyrinomonadaceae bacterium]